MAQTIKLKRSATSGAAPTTSQLELGEVAINTYDGKMYIKKNVGGTESIVEITGGSGGSSTLGGLSDVTISSAAADQLLQYNGSEWVNVSIAEASAIMKEYQFTATSGQSTFSGSDDNSETLSYTAGAIQVFLNGIFLDSAVDYTATNGTSIVLSETVDANDYLQVVAFKKKIGDGNVSVDTFTGNGSTTAFTLSVDPGDENNTRVFVDGVYQSKSNYSVSGTTLTFSTAPPADTAVEVEIGNRVVTLDTLSDLDLPDDVKLRLGTSQDADFYHDGTDTYLRNQTGQLLIRGNDTKLQSYLGETYATFANNGAATLYYDNSAKLATTSSGITVTGTAAADAFTFDNYTLDNNRISTNQSGGYSGDIMLDAAGDIILDADSGAWRFKDNGGSTLEISTGSGTSPTFYSPVSDADIVFKGNDGGSVITALTLDMSASGAAIFNDQITLGGNLIHAGNLTIDAGGDITLDAAGNDIILKDSGTTFGQLTNDSGNLIIYNSGSQMLKGLSTGSNAQFMGSLGIGVTPSSGIQLEIGNSANNSAVTRVRNGTVSVDLTASSSGKAFLEVGTAHPLVLATNATERMRIDSSGNLLVGTTAATAYNNSSDVYGFNVYANGQIASSVNGAQAAYFNRQNSDGAIVDLRKDGATVGTIGSNSAGGVPVLDISAHSSSGIMRMLTSGAERMRLDQNGKVGIGTASPVSLLHIKGSGTYNHTPANPQGADFVITSSEMGDNNAHSIMQLVSVRQSLTTGSGSTGYLGFSTMDDSNNVGINDAARIAIVNENGTSVTSPTALSFWTNTGTNGSTGAATERMRIDSSGNVGIGTSSLYGGTGVTSLTVGGTQYPSIALNVSGTNAHIITGYSDNLSFDAISTRYIRFNTNSVERMRIDGSTKNVGIGTSTLSTITTGVATLSLGGTNSGISGGIAYQTNGTPEAYHYTQDDMLLHQAVAGVGQRFLTNNTERMRIDTSGRLGIGTSAPTETLHVTGGGIKVDGEPTIATNSGAGLFFGYGSNVAKITALDQGVAWKSLRLNAAEHQFYIAGGLQAKLDASGNFLLGAATTNDQSSSMGGQTPDLYVPGYTSLGSLRINGADTGNTIYKTGGALGITVGDGNVIKLSHSSGTARLSSGHWEVLDGKQLRAYRGGNSAYGALYMDTAENLYVYNSWGAKSLVLKRDGNVAIGSTGAPHDLTIYNASGPTLYLVGGGYDDDVRIAFGGGDTTNTSSDGNTGAQIISTQSAASGQARGDLRFLTNPGDSLQTRLVIEEAGNVGIGTSNPGSPFHVSKDLDSGGNILQLTNADSTYNQHLTVKFNSSKDIEFEGASGNGGIIMDPGSRGTRFQISSADIGRFDSDGLRLEAGKGIKFSAHASTNVLDDYEEGTWTPGIEGASSGSLTMGSQNVGFYTKVGNTIHVCGTIHVSATTTLTGSLKLTGLPFVTKNVTGYRSNAAPVTNTMLSLPNSSYTVGIGVDANLTYAWIVGKDDYGKNYTHTPGQFSTGFFYGFSMTYETN